VVFCRTQLDGSDDAIVLEELDCAADRNQGKIRMRWQQCPKLLLREDRSLASPNRVDDFVVVGS
jgi:ribosome-binding factor A